MMMKKQLLCVLAAFIAFASFGQIEPEINLPLGAKAPLTDLIVQDISGEYVTLQNYVKENGIIVVFSCNTCPFVVGSGRFEGWEKQYNELAQLAADNNMGFVLVNSNQAKRDNEDSFEAMVKHAQDKGYTMPYLVDANSTMANAYGAKTTPHVFLFDAKVQLVYKGSIDNSWDSKRKKDIPYLKLAIEQLKKGKRISKPETAPKGCSIKRV